MCVRVLLDYVEDVAGIKDTEIRPQMLFGYAYELPGAST